MNCIHISSLWVWTNQLHSHQLPPVQTYQLNSHQPPTWCKQINCIHISSPWCKQINCVPISPTWCKHQGSSHQLHLVQTNQLHSDQLPLVQTYQLQFRFARETVILLQRHCCLCTSTTCVIVIDSTKFSSGRSHVHKLFYFVVNQ